MIHRLSCACRLCRTVPVRLAPCGLRTDHRDGSANSLQLCQQPIGKRIFYFQRQWRTGTADNNGFITKLDATENSPSKIHPRRDGRRHTPCAEGNGSQWTRPSTWPISTIYVHSISPTENPIATIPCRPTGQHSLNLTDVAYDGDRPVVLLGSACQSNLSCRTALPEGFHSGRRSGLGRARWDWPYIPSPAELIAVSWKKGKIFEIARRCQSRSSFPTAFSPAAFEPPRSGLRPLGQHVRVRFHNRQSLADDLGQTFSGHRRVSAFARRPQHRSHE